MPLCSCIFLATSSTWNSCSLIGEACDVLKCHPLSLSASSWIAEAHFCLTTLLAQSHVLLADVRWDMNASKMCIECVIRSLVQGCLQNESSLSNNIMKFKTVVSDSLKACKIVSGCTLEAM